MTLLGFAFGISNGWSESMLLELIVSEPFEAYERLRGRIHEPIWKAWSWPLSVRFESEDGRQLKLPAAIYFKLKYQGEGSVRLFSPLHGGLIIAYLRVISA